MTRRQVLRFLIIVVAISIISTLATYFIFFPMLVDYAHRQQDDGHDVQMSQLMQTSVTQTTQEEVSE